MRNFTLKLAAAALTFGAWATTAVPASVEDAILSVGDAVSDLSTVEGKTVLLVNTSSATNKGYAYVTSGHSCNPANLPFAGSERVATSGSADMPAVGSTDLSCVFTLVKNDDGTYSFQVYNDNTKWLSGDNQTVATAGTPVHVSDETDKAKVNMTMVNGTTWRVVNTSTTTNRIYLNVGAADKGGLVWYDKSDANTVFNIRPVTVGEATAVITFLYKDELGDAISSSTTTVLYTSENYTIPAAPDIEGYTNGTADQQTIASPSGNYTVTYTYEIADEETAVEGYTSLRTNIEEGLGCVTGYSQADYDASNMAAATTADEFRTAYAQLKGKERIAVNPNGYYRLTCNVRKLTAGINEGSTEVRGQSAIDKKSIDQLWQLEAVDGVENGYRLYSPNHKQYFSPVANRAVTLTDKNNAGIYTMSEIVPGFVNLAIGGNLLHGDQSGALITWNSQGLLTASAWKIVPAEDIEVALNAVDGKSYATVHLPFATTTGDVKAYYATAKDDANVTMTETTDGIAANQGALLVSESGATTATLTIADDVTAPTSNLLKGTNVATTITATDDYYIFGNGDAGVGFYHPNGTTLAANRAYIEAGTAAAASLKLSFGQTTGIGSIVNPAVDAAAAPLYDLQGRRVNSATKGIYIQGGKKVYVK